MTDPRSFSERLARVLEKRQAAEYRLTLNGPGKLASREPLSGADADSTKFGICSALLLIVLFMVEGFAKLEAISKFPADADAL